MNTDQPSEDLSDIDEEEEETTPTKKQKTDQTVQPHPLSASKLAKMSPHQILAEFKKIHPTTTHEGVPAFAQAFKVSEAVATDVIANAMDQVKEMEADAQEDNAMETDLPAEPHPTLYIQATFPAPHD